MADDNGLRRLPGILRVQLPENLAALGKVVEGGRGGWGGLAMEQQGVGLPRRGPGNDRTRGGPPGADTGGSPTDGGWGPMNDGWGFN